MPDMPVLFIGHGSPLNALSDNDYTRSLAEVGLTLPRPRSLLVISAHWHTRGFQVLDSTYPEQIYDFGGFPPALYAHQYRPPGDPGLASEITQALRDLPVQSSSQWGLDHGTWSVLTHLYPRADIPTLQLSIDMHQEASRHLELGQRLRWLREQGVVVVGSGNIVHNLSLIRPEENAPVYDWACNFDHQVKSAIIRRDFASLCQWTEWGEQAALAVPTPDHLLPLFPILGLLDEDETVQFFYEGIQHGSASMTSFISVPRV